MKNGARIVRQAGFVMNERLEQKIDGGSSDLPTVVFQPRPIIAVRAASEQDDSSVLGASLPVACQKRSRFLEEGQYYVWLVLTMPLQESRLADLMS